LLRAAAEAAAEGFAPVPLLALLKHPLVRQGEARLEWLEQVRSLDRRMRGPRPAPGLGGVRTRLEAAEGKAGGAKLIQWWSEVETLLAPLERAFAASTNFAALLAAVRETATVLAGDAAWSRTDGRAAAELVAGLELHSAQASAVRPGDIPLLLRHFADEIAVRPPHGGHPRIFIWGLIEARLQQADLMILGGLNEGTWPAAPAPDPWLAPRIRADLGLPGLERRIGLAAHDFAMGLGGRHVLVTRARRDARAPAIASRFWLRLEAMTGGLTRAPLLARWTGIIDRPDGFAPAARPAPRPPVEHRPRRIAVTKLDRLKADPFAFYADTMLGLGALDAVDADPSPAWRGSAVHDVLERWMKEDGCAPEALRPRAEQMLAEIAAHPVLRALWAPRLIEASEWVAATMTEQRAEGRTPVAAEIFGKAMVDGIELYGKVDRIDRTAAKQLAIVDYKTGKPPGRAQVAAGYAMQLGLLGLIAERGGFEGISGVPMLFEYWSLASQKGKLGYVASPTGRSKQGIGVEAEDFTGHAARIFADAAAKWLTGMEPFTAKLHPEYAPYGDYDQLMRLEEWYGRQDG
jgi:ATP-dependent helicase/nuclease subunit B